MAKGQIRGHNEGTVFECKDRDGHVTGYRAQISLPGGKRKSVSGLPVGHGLNAATLEYGDLGADGVIDPVKVTRSAVLNAASVARMVLSTETAIVEKPAEADDHGHGHHHGHAH